MVGARRAERVSPYSPVEEMGEMNVDIAQISTLQAGGSPFKVLQRQMRLHLGRESPLYKAIYTQRTSCEPINSQAQALGIEHPKVPNRRSVANLNTLIYLIINVRALDRAKAINRVLFQMK